MNSNSDFKTHGLPGLFHIIMTVFNKKFDYILKLYSGNTVKIYRVSHIEMVETKWL